MLKRILVVALLAALTPSVQGEYYTWVDENGVVNFSETNPAGKESIRVDPDARPERQPQFGELPPPPREPEPEPAPSTAATPESSESEVDPDELVAEEVAELVAKQAEVNRENCERGKRNLAKLQGYNRIKVRGEDGEERFMSEEEIAARSAEARQIVSEFCSG